MWWPNQKAKGATEPLSCRQRNLSSPGSSKSNGFGTVSARTFSCAHNASKQLGCHTHLHSFSSDVSSTTDPGPPEKRVGTGGSRFDVGKRPPLEKSAVHGGMCPEQRIYRYRGEWTPMTLCPRRILIPPLATRSAAEYQFVAATQESARVLQRYLMTLCLRRTLAPPLATRSAAEYQFLAVTQESVQDPLPIILLEMVPIQCVL